MPDRERAERVIGALGDAPISTPALEAMVDIRRTPLELLLKVLDVDGAVRRVQGGWVATGEPWTYDAERYERIAAECPMMLSKPYWWRTVRRRLSRSSARLFFSCSLSSETRTL